MHRFAAAILALTVTQQGPALPPSGSPETPPAPAPAAEPAAPVHSPSLPEPARAEPAAALLAPPAPPAQPAKPPPLPSPIARPTERAPPPPRPADPPRAQAPPPAAAPAPAPAPSPGARPATPPSQRDQLLTAALAFLDALLRDDAAGLAAASASRFLFDGQVVEGREAQARRWRELLAMRGPVPEQRLRDLVLLTGAEAIAQLGPPPKRVAALATPDGWTAIADVSGRPLVLFLARDGERFAVAGMSD